MNTAHLDGKHVLTASYDETVEVWNVKSRKVVASFGCDGSVWGCVVAPDGSIFMAGDAAGKIYFLRLEGIRDIALYPDRVETAGRVLQERRTTQCLNKTSSTTSS